MTTPASPPDPEITGVPPLGGAGLATGASRAASFSQADELLKEVLRPPQGSEEIGWLKHYRILRQLGAGGMGFVLEAEDTRLRRRVALKLMLPSIAGYADARDRFLREARATAALKNDHIVTIYEVGTEEDVPFLAMEYLRGQNVEGLVASGPAPTLGQILRIGRETALGLAAAHAEGLIHRDIKPANLWLEAPSGRVKILDFGLARATREAVHLTQTGVVIGTPAFMSPEQGRGLAVDARSDLFSLGSVLYYLCAGRLPFEAPDIMGLLTALAIEEPIPIRKINKDVPQPLVDLITWLLQKEPEKRPASADDVVAAIQQIEARLSTSLSIPLQTGTFGRSESGALVDTLPRPSPPTLAPGGRGGKAVAQPIRGSTRSWAMAGLAVVLVAAGALLWLVTNRSSEPAGAGDPAAGAPLAPTGVPIRIGVLHSQTGTMKDSEQPVIDATLVAVEDLNDRGGLLGRPVEPIIEDGMSDETVFAQKATKLIEQDKVCALFGCWTSASRKAVKQVVEAHDHLLFYPVQFEGLELSPNIVYDGAVPNQQILPALQWLYSAKKKKRWFLVGSDYIYPHAANAIIRDEAAELGAEIVGEEYVLWRAGPERLQTIVGRIRQSGADLVLNTINGDLNRDLFRALAAAGITATTTPTLSFSLPEEQLRSLEPKQIAGNYLAANYFECIDTPANQDFRKRFRAKYGDYRRVSDMMESGYECVNLWAKAVEAAGTIEPKPVRARVKGLQYSAPQGLVAIDPETQMSVQTPRVAIITDSGELALVYAEPRPVKPVPFPPPRSRAEWESFLQKLYDGWGGRWSNPGP